MADFVGMLFLLQFLVVICIFFVKFYNITLLGKFYDFKWTWLLFAGFLLCWGVGFVVAMFEVDTLLMYAVFRLESMMLGLVVLFTFIELLFELRDRSHKLIEAYRPGGE